MQAFRILEPQKAELREYRCGSFSVSTPPAPAVRQSSVVPQRHRTRVERGNERLGSPLSWLIGGGLAP